MSKQLSFFEPQLTDVLADMVTALGGAKKVGCKLRPDMEPDAAQRWLNSCLDPKRREKFDPDDLLRLLKAGRHINCHVLKHFLDDAAGYHRSDPKSVAEEKDDCLREIRANQERLEQQFRRLGQLDERERGEW